MTTERDRVISISLTEAEWQAFVAKQPQPVHWLREQILNQLHDARRDVRENPRASEASAR